ncbi:MAG: hypothetical protein RMK80_02625 [Pseudobdellovibrionaceae bacterium]|nr:hypothetical protein [Pseudobdellovibrionaceae bacterium]
MIRYSLVAYLVVLVIMFGYAQEGWSKFEGHLSYYSWSQKTEGNNLGNVESYLSDYQIKLGYNGGSYFVGLVYDHFINEIGNSRPRISYGVSLGYRSVNWFFDFNYFPVSTYEISSVTKLQDGSGFGFDVGYRWFVSSSFFGGLQVSFRTLSYNKIAIGSSTSNATNKISQEYHPALLLGVVF